MGKGKKTKPKKGAAKASLTQKDYNKLQHTAYRYVVAQGYSQKDAAKMLGVSEVSMSNWARDGKWKEQREARQQTSEADVQNLKQIIRLLSRRRLDIELQIHDAIKEADADQEIVLRKEARAISDEIAKQNKTLLSLEKDIQYTLGDLINIMDDVFTALREYDEELFDRTIPFQQFYVRKRTVELG